VAQKSAWLHSHFTWLDSRKMLVHAPWPSASPYAPISAAATDAATAMGAETADSSTFSVASDSVVVVVVAARGLAGTDSSEMLFFAFLRFFSRPITTKQLSRMQGNVKTK
jgi:hypothetical protein